VVTIKKTILKLHSRQIKKLQKDKTSIEYYMCFITHRNGWSNGVDFMMHGMVKALMMIRNSASSNPAEH
jgi:hypothetical protein